MFTSVRLMAVSILRIVNAAGKVFSMKFLKKMNYFLLVLNQWVLSQAKPDHWYQQKLFRHSFCLLHLVLINKGEGERPRSVKTPCQMELYTMIFNFFFMFSLFPRKVGTNSLQGLILCTKLLNACRFISVQPTAFKPIAWFKNKFERGENN